MVTITPVEMEPNYTENTRSRNMEAIFKKVTKVVFFNIPTEQTTQRKEATH